MEKRPAFARAWSFLNFKPVAKWSALVAAATYRERVDGEQPYVGILSTVVTTRDRWLIHRTVSTLARWNPWIWEEEKPLPYLGALLGVAIGLALVRGLLLYFMNYTAAL